MSSSRLHAQLGIVALYLRINACVFAAAAAALLLLPANKTSGPSLAVLYQLASRPVLGVAMVVVAGLLWACAYRWPHRGLALLMVVQTFWALSLAAPALLHREANLLAPLGWAGLAMTTGLQLQLRRRR